MSLRRSLSVPAVAVAALLVFTATASAAAETRIGESTTVSIMEAPSPEALLVKSTASFETAKGRGVLTFTTEAPPNPLHTTVMLGGFSTSECSSTPPPPPFSPPSMLVEMLENSPFLIMESETSQPSGQGFAGTLSAPFEPTVTKSVSDETTTLSVTSASVVEAGFRCAEMIASGESGASLMTVPIKEPPPPAPVVATPTATVAAPTPAPLPAPAVLSVAKPKPLKVKAKTWKTVYVKVSNTGATATAQGSLRVKAAKGVMVKPEVQKLPVLPSGASFSLSVRVKLSEAAKPTSTLPVTVTAPGVSATGSIVLKLRQ